MRTVASKADGKRIATDVPQRASATALEKKNARSLLTVAETAARLSVSEKTIRRLIGGQQLSAIRVGCSVRIDPSDLERYIAIRRDG